MLNVRSASERQLLIRNIVIKHDSYLETIDALTRSHMPVAGGLPSVGWLSAVTGESRAGKTFAASHYAEGFAASVGEGSIALPVLYVDMPMEGGGGPRAILDRLAERLGLSPTRRMTNPFVIASILETLAKRKVEHLLLDEWDQVFRENDRNLIGFGRGLLRKILNLGTVSITCIGLPATYRLLQRDAQLVGRGGLPHYRIQPYRWKTEDEQETFCLLCDTFDGLLPFDERAGLGQIDFASRLHFVTKGNVGTLKVYIEAAAAFAINDESTRIERKHFALAYEDRKPPGTAAFNPFLHDLSKAPKSVTDQAGRETKPPTFSKSGAKARQAEFADAD